MNRLWSLLIILTLLIAAPAYAFTPPSQGTDNATDVILWNGDNVTVESANVTGTANLTGSITIDAGTVTIDGLETVLQDYLLFAIILSFMVVVFTVKYKGQPHPFLNLMAFPLLLFYGISLTSGYDMFTAWWTAGTMIAILGTFCLIRVAVNAWTSRKKK